MESIFGKNKNTEGNRGNNEGGTFMAIPPERPGSVTEKEGIMANKRRERREFLEETITTIERDQTHPDHTNGNYKKYQEELRELQ